MPAGRRAAGRRRRRRRPGRARRIPPRRGAWVSSSSRDRVSRSSTRRSMRLRLLVMMPSWSLHSSGSGPGSVDHVLDEAGDHRQRRAQLVGDVGDEIAAHRLGPLDLGHVEADQQLAVLAEADRLDRQTPCLSCRAAGTAGTAPSLALAISSAKPRQADQVGHQQADVAFAAQAEVLLGDAVAPDDVVVGVEDHQPVGRGLGRLAENLQVGLDAVARLGSCAQQAVELDEDVAPGAPGIGNLWLSGALEPALQAASWKACGPAAAAAGGRLAVAQPACGAEPGADDHPPAGDQPAGSSSADPRRIPCLCHA
jgi:hypothetical protein